MTNQLGLLAISVALGFGTPFLLSASAPAPPLPVPPAPAPGLEDPCVAGWSSTVYSSCFCIQDVFAIVVDAVECGTLGDTCEGTVFWEICGMSGASGPHYLNCEDSTYVPIRCPLGGLASSVSLWCDLCDF